MSTGAKVLIALIAVVCIAFVYLTASVLHIQSAWGERVAQVQDEIEQAQTQLEATLKSTRDTTKAVTEMQYGWGRTWHQVAAVPQGQNVTVELGRRDGLREGEILYAFRFGQAQPLYLGQFQVVPNDLADNSAVLTVFPEGNANPNDPVEQANLKRRLDRIAQAGTEPWLLRNDLPAGYKQQLLTWTRLLKEQQYETNAAQSDLLTWEGTRATVQSDLATREAELAQAETDLAKVDDERAVEVRARFETREALRRTVESLRETLEKNRQLALRAADLESRLIQAQQKKQGAAAPIAAR